MFEMTTPGYEELAEYIQRNIISTLKVPMEEVRRLIGPTSGWYIDIQEVTLYKTKTREVFAKVVIKCRENCDPVVLMNIGEEILSRLGYMVVGRAGKLRGYLREGYGVFIGVYKLARSPGSELEERVPRYRGVGTAERRRRVPPSVFMG